MQSSGARRAGRAVRGIRQQSVPRIGLAPAGDAEPARSSWRISRNRGPGPARLPGRGLGLAPHSLLRRFGRDQIRL